MITIYIMGKAYQVPFGLTIMKAMEYSGYRFIRGSGCRAGFCGACATIYRKKGEYKFQTALACQTTAEDGMYLAQLPFVPANRNEYEINSMNPEKNVLSVYYPEINRCVSCNTCTKACPQELDVMYYIQAAIRGDYREVSTLSFDCIQCGLCAARCPAEITHYHVAQLARRIYGKYYSRTPAHLLERIEEIEGGKFDKEIGRLKKMSEMDLEKIYVERDIQKLPRGEVSE